MHVSQNSWKKSSMLPENFRISFTCATIEQNKKVMRVKSDVLRAHRSLFELNRVVRAADNASDCRRTPNCRATKWDEFSATE